ncbi:hypothetical protein F4775DRAFT_605025 [Biscogniauxia sp. FL1348]|nr:hypothetical protein F4775DRAFT_605025 [Biscogniauxia sp. FL1348]
MAFTAVHYPMDKDKGHITYWPDNDEMAMAGDNFFDQFVTFDTGESAALGGGDLFQNPPSPSILLDSLDDSLTNSSSNDHDFHTGLTGGDAAFTVASDQFTIPSHAVTTEHRTPIPDVLTTLVADPILSNGSISDSELLRLEGISLKSPNTTASAPSSPPFANTASASPRKHNRFVESLYATIRRATHRSKPHRPTRSQRTNVPIMDVFQGGINTNHDMPGLGIDDYKDHRIEIKPEPIDSNGLPLSPPLTGRIPMDQPSHAMQFVNGHFEDPFCEDLLAPPATITPARGLDNNTPISTPVTDSDLFYQQAMVAMDTNSYRRQPKPLRNASSAEWPMEGILTDDVSANIWPPSISPSTAYLPENNGCMPESMNWWESPQTIVENDMQPMRHRSEHNLHSHYQNQSQNLSIRHASSLNFSLQNHGQQQQVDHQNHNSNNDNNNNFPFEYEDDFSGLMIHMPQPRQPQAAVLSSNISDALSANYSLAPPPPPPPAPAPAAVPSHHHQHHQPHPHSHHGTERRPRPRAPSSGARHHGSLTSPRKLHHSGSRPYLREESPSPTPTPHSSSGSGGSSSRPHPPHQRSSSITVRKRRSWCRRDASSSSSSASAPSHHQQMQQAPRTPNPGRSRSPSFGGGGMMMGSGGGGGGGGGGMIDFVNFTPSDKNVLMTGVAPSGSSKTKARREKEALEKRRRLSEAALKAVRAAGGDIDKLVSEGFVI